MSDLEESVWVIFNGEIYNFLELKKDLEGYGHRFRTRSDTEVIVHGYKQWGLGVFDRLRGMFGIAIWDATIRRLVLARDPMGIKQVYYQIANGTLWFGSEIRPVLAGSNLKPGIDPASLNMFLRFRYTPSPRTIFEGIGKLAPGTMMVVENGNYRIERWYRHLPKLADREDSIEDATHKLLDLYRKAVARHLISDVPVGLLLSGGVDSGLLLGLMHEQRNGWLTYSVGYGDSYRDDELAHAAETARIYAARNTSITLDRKTFERHLPEIVSYLEEPIASPSIVPLYFGCKRAREDVKVALIGQGPDELFGGYIRHLGIRYGSWWRNLPAWVRTPLARISRSMPRSEAIKRGVGALATEDRMSRYRGVFSLLPAERINGLFREEQQPDNFEEAIMECWSDFDGPIEGTDELGGFQLLELRSSLPDELLMYADKLSMAHGLEVRIPYLDQDVVEYAQSLPASFKVRSGRRKYLHREVCRKFLPREILKRKKRGFAVNVVDDWFRGSITAGLKDVVLDSESLIYKILDQQAVVRLSSEHHSGRNDHHKILFSVMLLEHWMRLQ